MLFVSIIEYNEIIFNPVNELSSQKQLWKKKSKGVKETCDGKKKRNVSPELLLLTFSM